MQRRVIDKHKKLKAFHSNSVLNIPAFRRTVGQLFKYGLVGIAANISGYLAYLAMTHYGASPQTAVTVLYPAVALTGYLGNRIWTFACKGKIIASAAKYFVAHLLGYMLNLAVLRLGVNMLEYPHQIVQALAIAVVAVFLFLAFKFFVFATTYSQDEPV